MKRALLDALHAALASRTPAAVLTAVEDGEQWLYCDGAWSPEPPAVTDLAARLEAALRSDRSAVLEEDGCSYFLHVHSPPPRLIVVGAVHIAQPLTQMAQLAGHHLTLVDPREAWATPERFPGVAIDRRWPDAALEALAPDRRTAIVTLTHDPKLDDPALRAALASDAYYVGSLGSRRTHARRLERLAAEGVAEADLARIHGPVGLAIGASSPAEIAVSILAQVTEALRRESG